MFLCMNVKILGGFGLFDMRGGEARTTGLSASFCMRIDMVYILICELLQVDRIPYYCICMIKPTVLHCES
jgi:hypothetical protein